MVSDSVWAHEPHFVVCSTTDCDPQQDSDGTEMKASACTGRLAPVGTTGVWEQGERKSHWLLGPFSSSKQKRTCRPQVRALASVLLAAAVGWRL